MTTISGSDRPTSTHRRLVLALLAAVVLIALAIPIGLKSLGALTSDTATSAASLGSTGLLAPGDRDASSGAAVPAPQKPLLPADGTNGPAAVATEAKIARSAWLGIEVKDLTAASVQARTVATSAGGQVTSENVVTAADPTGGVKEGGTADGARPDLPPVGVNEARLSLSVPANKLDPVLAELNRLGTVSYRSSQSQDVTDSYIDTQARIATMQTGVDSIRALLAKATGLDQIIKLESELTNRQADLDSLTGRLASLDRRTTMSEVTLTLWTAATKAAEPSDDNAFVANLNAAWDTFVTSASVILTGLAALLPWLVIALLVAFLLRRTLRDRFSRTPTSPATPTTPATTD